jgi:hypothetical protein
MTLRRLALAAVSLLLASAAVAASAALWVERELAAAERAPPAACLPAAYRAVLAAGALRQEQKDALVSRAINRARGQPRSMMWWHLKGAAIHLTWTSLWPQERRRAAFARLAARMPPCRHDTRLPIRSASGRAFDPPRLRVNPQPPQAVTN